MYFKHFPSYKSDIRNLQIGRKCHRLRSQVAMGMGMGWQFPTLQQPVPVTWVWWISWVLLICVIKPWPAAATLLSPTLSPTTPLDNSDDNEDKTADTMRWQEWANERVYKMHLKNFFIILFSDYMEHRTTTHDGGVCPSLSCHHCHFNTVRGYAPPCHSLLQVQHGEGYTLHVMSSWFWHDRVGCTSPSHSKFDMVRRGMPSPCHVVANSVAPILKWRGGIPSLPSFTCAFNAERRVMPSLLL